MTTDGWTQRAAAGAAVLVAVLLAVIGCLAPKEGRQASGKVIDRPAIEASTVSGSAYDLVRTLRPAWLRVRGKATRGYPRVYVDGLRRSGRPVDVLGAIPVRLVQRVQYLSTQEATARFGTGHEHGAILVETR
jgi:hypothetical protein